MATMIGWWHWWRVCKSLIEILCRVAEWLIDTHGDNIVTPPPPALPFYHWLLERPDVDENNRILFVPCPSHIRCRCQCARHCSPQCRDVGILRVCRCRVPPPASSSPSPEADEVNFAQFSRISPARPRPPNKLVRNAPKLVQSVTISTQADLRTWEVLYSKELNNIVVSIFRPAMHEAFFSVYFMLGYFQKTSFSFDWPGLKPYYWVTSQTQTHTG